MWYFFARGNSSSITNSISRVNLSTLMIFRPVLGNFSRQTQYIGEKSALRNACVRHTRDHAVMWYCFARGNSSSITNFISRTNLSTLMIFSTFGRILSGTTRGSA